MSANDSVMGWTDNAVSCLVRQMDRQCGTLSYETDGQTVWYFVL